MRKHNQPGCKCCGPGSGTLVVHVTKCGAAAAAGETVTVTETGGTATTDASGNATFILAAGTYNGTTTAPTHYGTGSFGPSTVTSGGTTTVNVVLAPSAGYSCTDDTCCPAGGSAPFTAWSRPSTLYLSDGFGTITLTWSTDGWYGTASRNAGIAFVITDCATPAGAFGLDVDIHYAIRCPGSVSSVWNLDLQMRTPRCVGGPAANGLTTPAGAGTYLPWDLLSGGGGGIPASSWDGTGTCRPFARSHNYVYGSSTDTEFIYAFYPTSRTFTVTE